MPYRFPAQSLSGAAAFALAGLLLVLTASPLAAQTDFYSLGAR
jgi:hypothetical protein